MPRFLLTAKWLVPLSVLGAGAVALGEQDVATLPFVALCFVAIGGLALLLSRRAAFSVIAAWAILAFVTLVSALKMKFLSMSLHAADLYFYLRDTAPLDFIVRSYPVPATLAASALLGAVVVCALAYRKDRPGARLRVAGLAAAIVALPLAVVAYPSSAKDQSYYFGYHLTSSFFTSLRDVSSFSEPSRADEIAAAPPALAGYRGGIDCTAVPAKPDIVVALMESAFPPSLYPGLSVPQSLDASFRSEDGRLRGLQVETFGGGTWISMVSLMTGLSAADFAWKRPHLTTYLNGKVSLALPNLLKMCGYRTAVISPLPYAFINEGPFLKSLGIDDYLDFKALGAPSKHEPDSFYFDAALKYLKAAHAEDDRPVFLFVMTMAAHGPYTDKFAAHVAVDGFPFGNDAETDEYLRRLSMQRTALKSFLDDLGRTQGRKGTLFVEFGDHQPSAVRALVQQKFGEQSFSAFGSIAYRTYYRILPVGLTLAAPLPDVETMDLAYLGPTLMEAAGLPLSDVHRELIALRAACDGALHLCPDRRRVDRHLERLIAGGLLRLRDEGGAGPVSQAFAAPAPAARN